MVIAIMTLVPMANAQDTWKPKTPRKELNMGGVTLHRQGYYYWISAKTDNMFDEHRMSITLGKGRAEALESINKLVEISELPSGNELPFDDARLEIHGNYIKIAEIKGKFYWGKAIILDSSIKKMQKFIEQGK